jgi:cytochrome c5
MNTKLINRIFVAAGLSVMLVACGGDKPNKQDEAALAARAQTLIPADEALASVYDRSCKTCHAVAGTGAPLTGDTAGWQPRMGQGMDLLVDHVVTGFGGMPPFGFCMDCDAEQFEALIQFMAAGE